MLKTFFNPFTKFSDGEISMEKNPMASSPHLIEYFLIMGYDELYIQEKIIKNFNSQTQLDLEIAEQKSKKINPESKILNEYKCRNLPSILFSLGANFPEPLISENDLIKNVFPVPPSVFYSIIDNNLKFEPIPNNVVFSNIQNTVVNIGYAHIFYEAKNILEKVRIFIPKAFVIISQYPFFNTYKSICMELLNQFKNKSLQIPIEIQLYNIINFINAPIDSGIIMTLFPSNELSEIVSKCTNNKELIELNRQEKYELNQLSGYRETEVDISVIFCILNSEIIIEIFIQLLAGHTIAIFSSNISLLNTTIFIFQEMFYPLSNDESVTVLSPLKFFNSDMIEQNMVGFVCSYDELETFEKGNKDYRTLCDDDDEDANENPKMFDCDFILDLDKKKFEYLESDCSETISNSENVQKISEWVKKIISTNNKETGTNFEKALRKLSKNLNEIAFKLTYVNKNQTIPDYLVKENQFNRKIQNLFYSFMLDISYEFFHSISKYSGDYENTRKTEIKPREECELNEEEYLFFSLFSKTYYYKVLTNFIGGYSKGELLIYRTPKMIFENLMNIKKLSEKMNLSKIGDDFYGLIDEIYGISVTNQNEPREISFLNFYRYYKDHMARDIYDLVSNKFVSAKVGKNDKNNIKYEYIGINLDKNLLLEYKYLIDTLDPNARNKIFNIEDNTYDIFKPINLKITQRSIYNCIEQYFIKNKSIDYIAVINFSILNIVALTVHKRTILPFIISIYKIFMNLPCSVRKYQEIIFLIIIRLIKTQKKYNYQYFDKYFTIYETCKDLGLFLNDQLLMILKEINEIKENYKDIKIEEPKEEIERGKTIVTTKSDKLYSIDCKKKPKDIIPIIQTNISTPIGSSKLTFKSKLYNNNKKIEYKETLPPLMIYNLTNEMLDGYLQDLDYEKINKEKFQEAVIHLIYFNHILPDKFPQDINKFLFNCLDDSKNIKKKK
jgi:hypothetical protein